MDIPFDMNFTPTEDGLREIPSNRAEMVKGVEFLIEESSKNDVELEKADLLYQAGVYSRILENYSESADLLNKASDAFKKHDKKSMFIAVQLRLATTYSWEQNYTKSDDIYGKILKKLESMGDKDVFIKHKDYAYQHLGKSLMERRRYNDALDMLMKAMELRLQRGDMELIKATEDMLSVIRVKIEEEKNS